MRCQSSTDKRHTHIARLVLGELFDELSELLVAVVVPLLGVPVSVALYAISVANMYPGSGTVPVVIVAFTSAKD